MDAVRTRSGRLHITKSEGDTHKKGEGKTFKSSSSFHPRHHLTQILAQVQARSSVGIGRGGGGSKPNIAPKPTETDTSAQDIKDLQCRLVKIEEQLAKIADNQCRLVKIEEQLAKIADEAISGIQHPILANAVPRDPRWYEQPNIILAIIFLAALYLKH